MNYRMFVNFLCLLFVTSILTGCGGTEDVAEQTPDVAQPTPSATPAPADVPGATSSDEPDIAMIEAFTARLKQKYPKSLWFKNAGYDGIAWSSDVKKTDSLVDPIQATITLIDCPEMASSENPAMRINFVYSWKGGKWTPLSLTTNRPKADFAIELTVGVVLPRKSGQWIC